MALENLLIAILIAMIITLGITLYRIGKIVDRMLERSIQIKYSVHDIGENIDGMLETLNKAQGIERSKQQKEYEQKMLSDLINEITKEDKSK
tara:strand:- start:296 stop:571 length:276 start_codon:yes stop_codon:yes gene_type:complete